VRIGLYTWGSEGDVRPFVALAAGLVRAGHEVSLGYVAIDGRDWGPTCAPLGIASRSIAPATMEAARRAPGPHLDALVGKGNAAAQVQSVVEGLLDPVVGEMWEDAHASVDGLDVAVVHLLFHPAFAAAAARGIPLVTVQPAPVTPTRHLPPMGAPDLGSLNSLSWALTDLVARLWIVPRFNASRARAGLPPIQSIFPPPRAEVALSLTCVSPTLVPRPDDWDATHLVTGFFDLPPGAHAWEPPPELEAFLAGGEPPVLMTFGSMLAMPGEETTYCVRVMLEAAELAGCRAIVQAPWAELPELPRSPRVLRLGRAPHAELLPRCRAMVHHGGAGTTQAACLAGRPSVVVPFLGDQFFWAARLRALGIAPAPVPRRGLTAAGLAKELRALLADGDAPGRAEAVAAAMRREDGVALAVARIEALVP
jgi:UDP:flavonoid glycosyltransferase YjiC (YdhE family)